MKCSTRSVKYPGWANAEHKKALTSMNYVMKLRLDVKGSTGFDPGMFGKSEQDRDGT